MYLIAITSVKSFEQTGKEINMEPIIILALILLLFVSFWVIGKNKREHIDDLTDFTKEKYDLENTVKSLRLQIDCLKSQMNVDKSSRNILEQSLKHETEMGKSYQDDVENLKNELACCQKEFDEYLEQGEIRRKRIETVLKNYDIPRAVGATKKICSILKGEK